MAPLSKANPPCPAGHSGHPYKGGVLSCPAPGHELGPDKCPVLSGMSGMSGAPMTVPPAQSVARKKSRVKIWRVRRAAIFEPRHVFSRGSKTGPRVRFSAQRYGARGRLRPSSAGNPLPARTSQADLLILDKRVQASDACHNVSNILILLHLSATRHSGAFGLLVADPQRTRGERIRLARRVPTVKGARQ